MKHQTIVVVTAEWDDEASVWVATSEDENIGLVTEAETLDELKDRALVVLPELIQDNLQGTGVPPNGMKLCARIEFSPI
ncbi:DUF1902 domain-containing protein [Roseibium sp. MMSF_3544]|uniref:DUF1902 domain-containing protein n=1 Tax=unclassified Roseibium TaxID=2629323 RepID=UPI00273D7DC2|nr:DUF1902 domain-containing protein [Roseibium sp. MMSF_3544]